MNRIRLLLIATGAAFILTMVIFLGNPMAIGAAQKCAIVHISSHEGIDRETLTISRGDCVVWINMTHGEGVKITFREGKKCADMTKSPVGFKPDWSGCYLTDYLDFGKTSSLIFVEAGTFKYEVQFSSTGSPLGADRLGIARFGTIIVK